jgi:dolichol-phosphate mannosyltransferase
MISVVVPVLDEEDNIEPLVAEIAAAAESCPITEILYVDDGSRDGTPAVLQALILRQPMLRALRHEARCGQSAAMWTGVSGAQGPLVVTLDGDGQNVPADIPRLYARYEEEAKRRGARNIMVAGQRAKRNDNWLRRVSSRIANKVRSAMLQDGVRDTGCSLKLFRREDYLALPFFDHMHRFLPALMKREGVALALVDVGHRSRQKGVSKYGMWNRLFVGIHDLLGVMWLNRRRRKKVTVEEIR